MPLNYARKIGLCIFIFLICIAVSPASAQEPKEPLIQIYSSEKQQVIQTIPMNEEIREQVASWFSTITGISPKLKIDTPKGLAIRFPLDPPLTFSNTWVPSAHAKEVFLLLDQSQKEPPMLLVFTTDQRSHVFTFSHNIQPFLHKNRIRIHK
jgi:hypothetical protein